jgi:dihydroorotase
MLGLSLCFGLLMSLVHGDKLSLGAAIRALTAGPASVLGVPCPVLREGEPADLVVVSPDQPWLIEPGAEHGKSRNTPFMGQTLRGRVDLTLASGCLAFDRVAATAAPSMEHP